MSDFDNDPRRQQELKARNYFNYVYKKVLGAKKVKRFDRDLNNERFLLDKEFGIDVRITLDSGMRLTAQEKVLSYKYASYNSLTMEYMNNKHKTGDWFNLCAQLYIVGYLTESEGGFYKIGIFDLPRLAYYTNNGVIKWQDNRNMDGRAKASFKWINIKKIPDDCIIWQKGFK